MNWNFCVKFTLIFLLRPLIVRSQNNETFSINSTDETSTTASSLNPQLRSALLKALVDLENEQSNETEDNNDENNNEALVKKAVASAFTFSTNSTENSDDESRAEVVVFQKSENVEASNNNNNNNNNNNSSIIEAAAPSDAEQIITSASSSFTQNNLNSIHDAVDEDLIDEDKSEKNEDLKIDVTTTEESQAKVEQVQFFSAPLVAAFTVHQDEQGQPKKVEAIYKNNNNDNDDDEKIQHSTITTTSTTTQTPLVLSAFNNYDLIHKQKLLEQELEKLRVQQQNLFSGHSNQLEPVFSEPDRSIVTKLAAIDPTQLLNHQNNHFPVVMNRFTSSDAIPAPKIIQSNSGEVSLTPSISYNPFIEAGKLPENAQILPTKPPTGFHSFVKLSPPLLQNKFPSQQNHLIPQNNINNRLLRQEAAAGINFQQNFNNAINNNLRLPSLNSQNNNNRFLRQEIPNNVNAFSIVAAQQPFPPKHEFSYFPIDINNNNDNNNNNRFLRQNQNNEILQPPLQNFNQFFIPQQPQSLRFLPPQSIITFTHQQQPQNNLNNRFLRSNSDEAVVSQQNGLFQTYKYSNSFGFPSSLFNK